MNTKERLKEQRRAGWRTGSQLGIGIAMGFAIGFGMNTLTGASGMTPEWAFYLIAYGLGAVSFLMVWWLAGYELTRSHKTETR